MTTPDFDEIIDRRGTHSAKWDNLETYYGLSPDEGIPMWVADMDFRPPACVTQALRDFVDQGVFGYFGDDTAYKNAIVWWMQNRHGWQVDPDAIFSTHGLVNGTGLCLQAFTEPGDGIVMFTPIYHAFARVINAADRKVVECPMVLDEGRYRLDFDAYDAQMTGNEKMLLLCSPHNPGGRVWTQAELEGMAAFAKRHDLIIVSDEIHHDLVMPGQKHIPMAVACPEIADRLVMMTATTKTFNLAGGHVGNVIIHDAALRRRFEKVMGALGISPNSFALHMATAAYSPEGAEWVDALCDYLDGNRKVFDAGIEAIPGLKSMRLEGTYLAWVDFSGTGMDPAEVKRRILEEAKIAVNYGAVFGLGGDDFQRFNLATPRARVEEAVARMQAAFADLQ
ncbi:Cystathionine beta-lyase PatB [Pseudooceanicola marinus]|uniref:cysteine-S-conjugate beta-lyase n=1 Tax=Pseudooceanicola marinus TaxID=396013 RepID=A0A1X6ZUN6_9RHOB|nr:MalY/PatB family protein [Pseudooceanicola marinus]PJE30551.1 pyridoxal phosphate-dependent aminotransferase [Pseudooceanicola marinus]SLN61916.1 Cystathionine beta-lyase PatB [Pseudooceanicola marinus]